MFLTNTKALKNDARITPDPSTGWKMLYESEVKWHEIEMAMIKCEHSAIVNENVVLYNEGVAEYKEKAKKWFAFIRQEFLRYLDKVIDTWVNLQNKVRTWFFDEDAANKRIDKLESDAEVKIPARTAAFLQSGIDFAAKGIRTFKNDVDKSVKLIHDAMKKGKGMSTAQSEYKKAGEYTQDNFLDAIERKAGSGDVPFNANEAKAWLKKAVTFIKNDRINAVKALQYARNAFVKVMNECLKHEDTDADDLSDMRTAINGFRKNVNEYITLINKATNATMSIIKKLKAYGTKK